MKKGFTLLFSVLVTSLLLAIALSIIGLSTKHNLISSIGRESQVAFYSADSGLECAKYWDQPTVDRDAFSTSTPRTDITCFGVTIPVVNMTPSAPASCDYTTGTCRKYQVAFSLVPSLPNNPDGDIFIEKNIVTSETTIDSRGRNTDRLTDPRRLERAVKLTYTPPRKSTQCPVGDIMLVVDTSGSMDNDELATLKNTIKNSILPSLYGLAPYNRVGIIMFGNRALTAVHLSDESASTTIMDAVDSIRTGGIDVGVNTNTVLGLRYAINEFTDQIDLNMNNSNHIVNTQPASAIYDRPEYQNVVILLADGGNDTYIDDAGTILGTPYKYKNNMCNNYSGNCNGGSPITSANVRAEAATLKTGPARASVFTLGIGTLGQLCHSANGGQMNCSDFLKNYIATGPEYAHSIDSFDQARFNTAIASITSCPEEV